MEGPVGSAIEISYEPEPEVGDPPDSGLVASWVLHCPGQSLGWEYFCLSVVHLRDLPGMRPPVLTTPGASHEVILMALSPDDPVPPAGPVKFLTPLNFVEQTYVSSDHDAHRLGEFLVKSMVAGQLWAEPPLSGQKEPWSSMLQSTAAHLCGAHDHLLN